MARDLSSFVQAVRAAAVLLLLPAAVSSSSFDPLPLIDPLIGSANGGNVFAGASLPYGLAKAVADVWIDGGAATGGFASDNNTAPVTGFSAVHDSGTGGNPSLGNFPLFPQLCTTDDVNSCAYRIEDRMTPYASGSVVAQPGYFALELESSGIRAEMTAAERAALFRFSFPITNDSATPSILVDLSDLWQSRQNATVEVDPHTGRMTGTGTFLPSFGSGSYELHFCTDFYDDSDSSAAYGGGAGRAPIFDTGVWVNSRGGTEPKKVFLTRGFNLFYLEGGAFIRFDPSAATDGVLNITARVGISYISVEQACRNAATNIPEPTPSAFDGLVSAAQDAWRAKLSGVSVTPGDSGNASASLSLQRSFWSGLYRNMLSPQNYTGENPKWDSSREGIPYFDSYYCIWDAFRAQHPLLTVLDPAAQGQMLASLLDMYRHEGWLPDCHMSMCTGWTQGGSNADVVLADAFVKNVTIPGFAQPYQLALEAVRNDAENEPLEWAVHGRGGLASWKRLGYIPYLDFDPAGFGTNSRSISRTLEYAYDDFALATLADGLGRPDWAALYRQRSTNWQNLWKADERSTVPIGGPDTGFAGFFQPKFLNGTWGFQDPIACSSLAGFCSLTTNPSETFEASIWQYQFLVPHDVSSLIALMGGDDDFIARLDYFHASGLADISNEPVFLTVFLYHYAGRPGLSAERVRTYIPSSFNATHDGLPGNDDSGAMGAFFVFAVLGLFPVAGQDVYLISPPLFREIAFTHPLTGRTATVRCLGQSPSTAAGSPVLYIQSATLDGQAWTKSWLTHAFFSQGGTLELTLGTSESDWGTHDADRPPSYGGSASERM